MHIFGGTPATGLICALYSVARSVLVAALVLPLGYAAFTTLEVSITTVFIPNECMYMYVCMCVSVQYV